MSVSNGIAEKQFSMFLAKATDWHLERASMVLLDRVKVIPIGQPITASREAAEELLADEGQRVFNMMCAFATTFRDEFLPKLPTDVATALGSAVQAQVETDETMPGGLSQMAAASLVVAKAVLADEILKARDNGLLTLDKTKMLLGGGEGVAIVGRAMLHPIMGGLLNM